MRILASKKLLAAAFLAGAFHITAHAQQGNVNIEQDEKITELLKLKTELIEEKRLADRYSIQLFYGDNSEADDVIKEFREDYSDIPSIIVYEAPNYKVWVGDFRNRLEADRALRRIKKDFPAAFIPKPQNR